MAPSRRAGRRLRPSPSVHTRLFDGEMVILDMARGEYLALDRIGSRLWDALEAGRTLDDLAREIVDEYDVSLDQARADLEGLENELIARGLVIVDGKGEDTRIHLFDSAPALPVPEGIR